MILELFALKWRHWVESWVERCLISHIGPAKINFSAKIFCLKARYFLIFLVLNFFSLFVLMRCFWRPVKVNSSRLYDLSLIRFNFFDYICFLLCYLCGLFIEKLEPFFHLLGSLVCYVNIFLHFCNISFFF